MTLIEEFVHTLKYAEEYFAHHLIQQIQTTFVLNQSELYQLREKQLLKVLGQKTYKPNIEIVHNTTTQSIINSHADHLAALNFADGCEPGGLVWKGATTQEEQLCRTSTLYPTLITVFNKIYYYRVNQYKYERGKCTDTIIYSPKVYFFKDDKFNIIEPKECDIITCPAPMANTATDDEIIERMTYILTAATQYNVDELILGKWGCGAFGNDWEHFYQLWLKAINKMKPHYKIIFAIT